MVLGAELLTVALSFSACLDVDADDLAGSIDPVLLELAP